MVRCLAEEVTMAERRVPVMMRMVEVSCMSMRSVCDKRAHTGQ